MKNIDEKPLFKEKVVHKFLSNEKPTKRELSYWLFDLTFDVSVNIENMSVDEAENMTDFYYVTAHPFFKEAIKKKYGLQDAVLYIRYKVMNSLGAIGGRVEMKSIKELEDRFLKEVIKMFKKEKILN